MHTNSLLQTFSDFELHQLRALNTPANPPVSGTSEPPYELLRSQNALPCWPRSLFEVSQTTPPSGAPLSDPDAPPNTQDYTLGSV